MLKMRRFFMVLLFLVLLVTVMACEHGAQETGLDGEATIAHIAVDTTLTRIPQQIDRFKLSALTLVVTMQDGSVNRIALDETMISSEDLAKLNIAGEHQIQVDFGGLTTNFEMHLVEEQSLNEETATDGLIYSKTTFAGGQIGYVVSGYQGTDKDVVIPNHFDNKPVVGIATIAFIQSSIESIYKNKHKNCKGGTL